MDKTIYHHFMLGLFLLAAWTLGAVTGAGYVYYDKPAKKLTYNDVFKGN
jgi:hypothetical protein